MAAKLYLDETNLRASGVSEPNIRTLRALTVFVDTQNQLAEAQADIDANADDIADLVANDVALDARIDAYDALAPFVRQDQTSAWSNPSGTLSRATFTAYAAPDISAAYTEAEVQAIADALQVNSQRLAALITDLKTVNVLT